MDKQNMVFTCNGISFSLKKGEGNPTAWVNLGDVIQWDERIAEGQTCMLPFIGRIERSPVLTEQKVEWWLTGLGGGHGGLFSGYEVLLYEKNAWF